MAVKNLQTVASCVAKIFGVCAIGTERTGSKRFGLQASRSLPRLLRLGHYPMPTSSDAELLGADNAAAAKAVRWAGRSTRG